MKRKLLRVALPIATLGAVALASPVAGVSMPWVDDAPGLDGQEQMNADNAAKILESENVALFALPAEQPVGMDYLMTVQTTANDFEIAVQQQGSLFVLCDTENSETSACDEPSVEVIRDEQIGGRAVRIARVDLEPEKTADLVGTDAEVAGAIDFWRTVELTRDGAPPWISALAQGSSTQGNG